jgi:hypothetical protein
MYCTLEMEREGVKLLRQYLPDMEVRQWQDGTKSDVGVRPLGSTFDRWAPVQLKCCDADSVQFRLRGKDGMLPNCDTVCLALKSSKIFLFLHEELPLMNISKSGLLSMFDFNAWQPHTICVDDLYSTLLDRWYDDEGTFRERTLRWQVNENHAAELRNIEFSNQLQPDSSIEWPEHPMMAHDLVRDGEKEQYKSVQRKFNGFQGGDCSKMMCGVRVAYEVGDNDWYVFGYVDDKSRMYLQWRIPESFMQEEGMLSIRDEDGTFSYSGRQSIPLHVVGLENQNAEVQRTIVGKMPRSDVVPKTAQFLSVLRF